MALNPKPSASPLIAHLIPVPLTFIPAIVHHYYICIDISIIHSPHLSILPVHSFSSSHSFPSCPHALYHSIPCISPTLAYIRSTTPLHPLSLITFPIFHTHFYYHYSLSTPPYPSFIHPFLSLNLHTHYYS